MHSAINSVVECRPDSTDVGSSNLSSRTNHGFTLIDLIIVISIFAILAAILLPVINKNEELGCRKHDARITAIERCINDEQCAMTAKDYEDHETMKQWRDECRRKDSTKVY